MNDKMRVFVGGATGLTGRAVVSKLVERGAEVIAHVRPDSGQRAAWTERFEAAGATVDHTPWTAEAMANRFFELKPNCAFGLLGTTRSRMKSDGGSYQTVDYGMTAMLIDAAAAMPTSCRFIYLSAVGAPNGKGAYIRARADVEARLNASGLPFGIARPSFILGDRDTHRVGEAIGAAATNGVLSLARLVGARKLAGRYHSIPATELAEALVEMALNPSGERQHCDANALRRLAQKTRQPK